MSDFRTMGMSRLLVGPSDDITQIGNISRPTISFSHRALLKVGNIVYIASSPSNPTAGVAIYAYDVSDPANPVHVNSSSPLNVPGSSTRLQEGLKYLGDDIILLNTGGSFNSIDISTPTTPALLDSTSNTGLGGVEWDVSKSFAYTPQVAGVSGGVILNVHDISDPSNLSLSTSINDSLTVTGAGQAIYRSGSNLYVTYTSISPARNYFYRYDISSPGSPTVVSTIFPSGWSFDCACFGTDGTRLWGVDGTGTSPNRLVLWDISTPSAPSLLDFKSLTSGVSSILPSGTTTLDGRAGYYNDKLFVPSNGGHMNIISISGGAINYLTRFTTLSASHNSLYLEYPFLYAISPAGFTIYHLSGF